MRPAADPRGAPVPGFPGLRLVAVRLPPAERGGEERLAYLLRRESASPEAWCEQGGPYSSPEALIRAYQAGTMTFEPCTF